MLKRLTKLAKNLLAIAWIRKTYETATRATLEFGAANRLTATLYAIPGLLTFNREQYAVLRGRREYYRNLKKARITHVELRRNIHRLEKGMSMRPRRPVFARDYIGETLDFYVHAIELAKKSEHGIDQEVVGRDHGHERDEQRPQRPQHLRHAVAHQQHE